MNRKEMLNDIAPFVLISVVFLITEFSGLHVLKIILSMFFFYFYSGYLILDYLLKLYWNRNKDQNFNNLFIFEAVAFSFLIGFILNIVYGLFAIIFNLYPIRYLYYLYYLIIFIILLSVKSVNRENKIDHFIFKFKKNDFYALIGILLPTLIVISLYFFYSPFPYMTGWDLMKYQGITNEFLFGIRRYVIDFQNLNSSGFHFIQANMVISSNIPFYYLIEFDKIAVLFTNGMCAIWAYLICFHFTKSQKFSIITSFLLSTYNSGIALGPYYFLPSSLVWNIGLSLIFITITNLEKFNFHYIKSEFLNGKINNCTFFLFYSLLMVIIMFFIHIFTTLLIIIVISLLIFTNIEKLNIFVYILLILEVFLIISSQIPNISFILKFFSNIMDWVINDNSIEIWNFSYTYNNLVERNKLINPFFGLGLSIILLFSKKKEYKIIVLNFLIFLILLFIPFRAIYRIAYVVYIYNAIIISISILFLHDTIRNLYSKIKKNGYFAKQMNFINEKTKNLKLYQVMFIIWIICFCYPIANTIIDNFPHSLSHKIEDETSDDFYFSGYSEEEFLAAKWLNHNVDNPKDTNLCADPGSNRFLYGISGVHIYESYNNDIEGYRDIFINCDENGPDISFFQDFTTTKNKSLILVITPRMHKWIQTGSEEERFYANSTWINSTLIEYIGNSQNFDQIYFNSDVFVFLFIPNI